MNKEQQEFIIEHYDLIKDVLNNYKDDKIGLHEAEYCLGSIIELAIEKFNN
jgi:hypothetical protein